MNPETATGRDLILGYSLSVVRGEITENERWLRIAPWLDRVTSVYGNQGLNGGNQCLTDALAAVDDLSAIKQQIEMTMSLSGPSAGLLLERDLVDAVAGAATLLVLSVGTATLNAGTDVDEAEEQMADLAGALVKLAEFPSTWTLSQVAKRSYYLEHLDGLTEKMNITTEKGTS